MHESCRHWEGRGTDDKCRLWPFVCPLMCSGSPSGCAGQGIGIDKA